jgi:2-amino-4-hydroxy-6-hydroxymethyldihydropteridine diphosphokinase
MTAFSPVTAINGSRAPRTRCLIALGSNLGDRLENVRAGVAEIRRAPGIEITAVSPLYETAPVGGPDDQGPYLNAALAAVTTLGAAELLALMHRIEAGRERRRLVHWGPRTLDLDLLVHGDLVTDPGTGAGPTSDHKPLLVPHPRMHERRFVMVPVCDIAPDLVHPRLARTMLDLLADLPVEPGDLTEFDNNRHDDTQLDDARLDEARPDHPWHTIPEHHA